MKEAARAAENENKRKVPEEEKYVEGFDPLAVDEGKDIQIIDFSALK